jgi:hypothetical protein
MIKHLQKIGNSRGIVLDKPILRPLSAIEAYEHVAKKHRASLDKLSK